MQTKKSAPTRPIWKLGSTILFSALLPIACDTGTTPDSTGHGNVAEDLQTLASKAKYFSAPVKPSDAQAKTAAAKRATLSDTDLTLDDSDFNFGDDEPVAPECVNGIMIEESSDSTDALRPSLSRDTTLFFNASGNPACPESIDPENPENPPDPFAGGWQVVHSYYQDPILESWSQIRSETTVDTLGGFSFKATGTGRVHYASGYDMTMDEVVMEVGMSGVSQFKIVLGLEGGHYHVPLALAAEADLGDESADSADDVVMEGPIQHGHETVGYFQVMGDDKIVIRDADRNVVETH